MNLNLEYNYIKTTQDIITMAIHTGAEHNIDVTNTSIETLHSNIEDK